MLQGGPGPDGAPPPPRLTMAVRDYQGTVHSHTVARTVRCAVRLLLGSLHSSSQARPRWTSLLLGKLPPRGWSLWLAPATRHPQVSD